jgi:hypothetical protein
VFEPGLPDGIFSVQKCQFWYILEGLGMENFGVLHGKLVFLLLFGYNLWQSSMLWHFGTFSQILFFAPRKIWQPWLEQCEYGNEG